MALPLHIPPCIYNPTNKYHLLPHGQPLRIQIEGPLTAIQRLLPHTPRNICLQNQTFPQPAGPELARITYQQLYGRDPPPEVPGDLVVRDEYMGWMPQKYQNELAFSNDLVKQTDYYGVTFDHLVPADDPCPEVLQVNIIQIEDNNGVYANTWLLFAVDPADFIGKKVLGVPRCYQKSKGTQDRWRINALVDQMVNG